MKKNSIVPMKRSIFTVVILLAIPLFPETVKAQINLIPFAGINSTRVKYFDFLKGGNYGMLGLDIEGRFKPRKYSLLHISFTSGINYLANGFYRDSGISVPGLVLTTGVSDLRTSYIRIPLGLKMNWQPFPLIEDWRLFLGVAISIDFLLKSELAERETQVSIPIGILTSPPQTTSFEDSRDITNFGRKASQFQRIELGARFKRFQFAYRLSFSLNDMHHQGLENVWNIPMDKSTYIDPLELNGKRIEKYSEFVVGFVIK